MKKWLSYLYLALLTMMLVWLVFNHPPTILMMVALVCATLVAIGVGIALIYLKDAWDNFLYHQRLKRLLGNMSLEDVLEQSPYKYGYVFQGDDGYRIWHKDSTHDFIQSNVSKKSAQMWIVEQYFKTHQRR